MPRTLVVTSTFPQWEGDPRGAFIRRFWEVQASAREQVEVLAPQTRWCVGTLDSPLQVRRFVYAPKPCATLSGAFGILENLRARPHRAGLVPPFLVAMYAALRRALLEGACDRVVAHMVVPCGLVAGLAVEGSGAKLEIYGHGTDIDLLLAAPEPVRKLASSVLCRASVIYLPSHEKRQRLSAALPELAGRCQVASMAETIIEESVVRQPVPGRILFLGRLIRQKGVDDLIHAVADLDGQAHLHVAGDGPERKRLVSLADRLGVDAVFHGFVEGTRKRDALASASVLCVPSRDVGALSEGAPLVVREARVWGIPVVATRVGGIPELAGDDKLVTLVPSRDRAALRSALQTRLRCPA